MLEREETDILLSYQHTAFALNQDRRRVVRARTAHDCLVTVAKAAAERKTKARFNCGARIGCPARLRHSANLGAPELQVRMRCDWVGSLRECAPRGFGVAWLPRSMVAADLNSSLLTMPHNPAWQVLLETQLYRRQQVPSDAVIVIWNAMVGDADSRTSKR